MQQSSFLSAPFTLSEGLWFDGDEPAPGVWKRASLRGIIIMLQGGRKAAGWCSLPEFLQRTASCETLCKAVASSGPHVAGLVDGLHQFNRGECSAQKRECFLSTLG